MTGKRSIFEEVAGATPTRKTPGPRAAAPDARRGITRWLMVLFAALVLMIAVGGTTRLSDAGLAITEWKPVTGALPPMSAEDWSAEFDRYRAIPEYQLQNANMTLPEFKRIYWWEWGHRQLGRGIGLIWALGFFWFLARKQIPRGWTARLLGLGALGGAQGAVGWWMVSSGLAPGMLDVAATRLAVHLGLAFAILGLIAWYILHLSRDDVDMMQARRQREAGLARWASVLIAVLFIQILLGALVAGIDAGRSFADWPLIGGEAFPVGAFEITPKWQNFIANAGLVQFNHRMAGYLVLILALIAWWRARASALGAIRRDFAWLLVAVLAQVALGVLNILTSVPLALALLHQLGAVALFTLALRARFAALYPARQKLSS